MIEWLLWLLIALVIVGVVLWIVKAYVVPALPAPIQNAVMALVGIICIIALILIATQGHAPHL